MNQIAMLTIRQRYERLGYLIVAAAFMLLTAGPCMAGGIQTSPLSLVSGLVLPGGTPDIAGVWTITCEWPAPDCARISVTIDEAGALLDAEVPGLSGEIQGGASVDNGRPGERILEINILDGYTFEGVLIGNGFAQGRLKISDIENGQEVVPAFALRE
jgi:hypothetical protein